MREAVLQGDETFEEQLQALADRAAELEAEAERYARGGDLYASQSEPEEVDMPDVADLGEPLYVVPATTAGAAEPKEQPEPPADEAVPAPPPEEPAPVERPASESAKIAGDPEFVPSEAGSEVIPDPGGDPYPTMQVLEQRVQAAQERIYEWQYYLNLLRRHADENGVLPTHFQRLIEDVFSDYPGRRD